MGPTEQESAPTENQMAFIVSEKATPIVDFLKENSFSVTGIENRASSFGPAVDLILENRDSQRKVRAGLASVDGRPVANVMIVRLPRRGVSDDLFLELYVNKHAPELDTGQLDIDPKKPLPEEAGRVFKLYADLLAGPALPIIKGDSWEEGHYYDWTLHG